MLVKWHCENILITKTKKGKTSYNTFLNGPGTSVYPGVSTTPWRGEVLRVTCDTRVGGWWIACSGVEYVGSGGFPDT